MDWKQPIIVSHNQLLEQISIREKEKSTLLSLSNRIAAAQKREELWNVITEQLVSLFGGKYYTLCLINEDGKTHSPFLHTKEGAIKRRVDESPIMHKAHDIEDGIFNVALNADEPIIYDIKKLIRNKNVPPYIIHWHNSGIREMMVTKISNASQPKGLLYLYADQYGAFSPNQFALLTGVADMLGMGIGNILANEKIAHQQAEIEQLKNDKQYLNQRTSAAQLIGSSPEIQKIYKLISLVATADSTVIITGETGTGKELAATAIHQASPRAHQEMIRVNCAAIPATLIESELFGHEKGSFTGAIDKRIGKFEQADNSTIFLDEIGELSLELQAKLLRVLQEREIERIGGKGSIRVNVRIIAATNRNLEKEVQAGRFRSDLYYRLNVFPVSLPPLRQRKEDIPVLVTHFIHRYAQETRKKVTNISQKALNSLLNYSWPGNIRELEHVIERAVLLSTGTTISQINLPVNQTTLREDNFEIVPLAAMEREYILKVLKICKGKVSGPNGAAIMLGLPPTTLISKMQKLNIKKELLLVS
ncbi:sigma 54-interacting transcriptional regulator [Chitinophaga sp.]|uniref:sigma-54-dependent Fis family transcriptional regulator n=1 Tax=Chitinophaga sp. TaxID=1869181 RepID=UPI0031DDBA97